MRLLLIDRDDEEAATMSPIPRGPNSLALRRSSDIAPRHMSYNRLGVNKPGQRASTEANGRAHSYSRAGRCR